MLADRILEKLGQPEKDPIRFIRKHASEKNPETLNLLRDVFREMTKKNGTNDFLSHGLTDLYIDNFDSEQIWQQIELKNRLLFEYLGEIAQLLLSKDELNFPLKDYNFDNVKDQNNQIDEDESEEEEIDREEDARSQSENEESGEETSDEENRVDESEDTQTENASSSEGSDVEEEMKEEFSKEKMYPKKSSIVDDQFFNLHEMEEFLEKEENKEMEPKEDVDDDLEIDYFEDLSEDDGGKQIKYDDFFKNTEPSQDRKKSSHKKRRRTDTEESEIGKKVRFSFSEQDSDESDEEPQEKSSLEMRQSKLKQKIQKLEEEALSEKPWQLKGEIDASKRPVNSLLEEVVEYDITQRPAPVITEEVTQTLENIIINRIKDAAYDDVVRKIKPVKVPNEFKKELVLNQEKSKFSLAEIYEQEYLKKKQKENVQDEEIDKNEMTEEKKQIVKLMDSLFRKLDTLSNFHYTPKPASADIQIVNNAPAITMEEATPAAVSDANLLAPEEIAGKIKRPLQSKDERTATDKKRERRKKKSFQSKKFKREGSKKSAAGEKMQSLLKTRNISLAQKATHSPLNSSTKFFTKLQDEVK